MSLQKCVLEDYKVEVNFSFSLESIIKMNCTLQKKCCGMYFCRYVTFRCSFGVWHIEIDSKYKNYFGARQRH